MLFYTYQGRNADLIVKFELLNEAMIDNVRTWIWRREAQ